MRPDLLGSPFGDLGAKVEHHHALREREKEVHVVLDQQDGDAVCRDAADHRGDALGLGERQARRRLVEEHELRLAGERARDLEQPPLAERELLDRCLAQLAQADELDQLLGTAAQSGFLEKSSP